MSADSEQTTAVVVTRDDDGWQAGMLPERLGDDLDGVVSALRQQPGNDGAIALIDVADEFFVIVRLHAGQVRLLLSDVTAAVAWDLARQVVDDLDVDTPGEDDLEDVWPVGDLLILADLGLDELTLGAVLADLDAYADEMLTTIADQIGVGDVYRCALGAPLGAARQGDDQ